MRKLGGALNIAEATRPNQTHPTASPVEIAMARTGRGVNAIAVAAGVISRAKRSRLPTAWIAMVTARPSRSMKARERPRTLIPFARATSELIEL